MDYADRYKDSRTARGHDAAAKFAYGLHKIGQDAASEQIIQKVITSGEVSPQVGYIAAMIYKQRGRMNIAENLIRRCAESNVAFPEKQAAIKLLDVLGSASPNLEAVPSTTAPDAEKGAGVKPTEE